MQTCHSRPSANTLFTTNLLCPKHTIITWIHPPKLVWVIKCLGKKQNTQQHTHTHAHTRTHTHTYKKHSTKTCWTLYRNLCWTIKREKQTKTSQQLGKCLHTPSFTNTKSNTSKWGTKYMTVCPCFKTNPTQKSHHHKLLLACCLAETHNLIIH